MPAMQAVSAPPSAAPAAEPTPGASADLPAWATAKQSVGAKIDLVIRCVLALVATPIFVALAVAMRQFQVLVLLVMVLAGIAFLEGKEGLLSKYPVLWKVKILGNALKATHDLDVFYREHRPRSFLLYSVYPFYAFFGLIFSRVVRRELKLHAKVVAIVAVVLVLDVAASYGAVFPPYLGLKDAGSLLLGQFILVLIFCVMYLMPMTTTVYSLALSGKKKTSRGLIIGSLLLSAPMAWGTMENSKEMLPLIEQMRITARMSKPEFRSDLTDLSEMFLDRAEVRGWIRPRDGLPRVDPHATERFRRLVQGLVVGVENRAFDVFGFRAESGAWTGIRIVVGRKAYLLYLRSPQGDIYRTWKRVPEEAQKHFRAAPMVARDRADLVTRIGLIEDVAPKE